MYQFRDFPHYQNIRQKYYPSNVKGQMAHNKDTERISVRAKKILNFEKLKSAATHEIYSISQSPVAWPKGAAALSLVYLSTKMHNKESATFLALLRLFYCTGMGSKLFKASFETFIYGRLIF